MRRTLHAREPVSLQPVTVSQLTSLAVLGIDERRFRETFGKHPNASRVGKLLVVDVSDAREVLRALRAPDASPTTAANDEPDDVPGTVEGVLAAIGRRRVG